MTGQRQREITEWADAAFGGPWTSNARGVARMLEEVAELVTAVTTNAPPERVASECADVMICAFRLAAVEGFDLEAVLFQSALLESRGHAGAVDIVTDVLALTSRALARVIDGRDVTGVIGGIALRLHDLCRLVGHDLLVEVDAKMEVNWRREWEPDGTGCGRHVKTTTTGAAAT